MLDKQEAAKKFAPSFTPKTWWGVSQMSADDRLSLAPLGPVESGNRIVEDCHVADVCPQETN
ncbi:MAG TPA: hypothetical protein VH207_15275, partial [Chthoniobacterales bacterium]|nr:hypothetical protein [Chthoniobacterales bacterium]